MTDPIVTDAKTALADTKATIATLEADEKKDVSWVKAHWVVIAGAGGFILGCLTRLIH